MNENDRGECASLHRLACVVHTLQLIVKQNDAYGTVSIRSSTCASAGFASFDGSVDQSTMNLRRHLYTPSSHLVQTTVAPCRPGRQCPPLTDCSGC